MRQFAPEYVIACYGAPQQGVQYPVHGPALLRRAVTGVTRVPATYILPDLPWALLLEPIVRDARPGDVLLVYTDAMRRHVEQVVRAAGRGDLVVRHVEPPASSQVA